MTLLHNLMQSVQAAAKVNRTVQTQPAAILWTDKDRHWETVAAGLRSQMPGLLTLGAFDGAQRTGPAIWLKCAIAGAFENIDFAGQTPVIYLPGISRTDLRPEDLTEPDRGLIFPGDRVGNVAQLLSLIAAGYGGFVSIEPFDPAAQNDPDLARKLRASLDYITALVRTA